MPGYDRSGPLGQGEGTGRGLGRRGAGRTETVESDKMPGVVQRNRRRRCRRDHSGFGGGGGGRRRLGEGGTRPVGRNFGRE